MLFSIEKQKDKENDVDIQQLYAQIGKPQVQNDFLKKSCNETPKRKIKYD